MSSTAYLAEISPESSLRRVVLLSGALCAGIGVAAILSLPLEYWTRIAFAAAWLGVATCELWQLHRAWFDCLALRFSADGEIYILGRDQEWRPGRWLPGGILLRRWGWIRLENHNGAVFGELIRGDCRTGQQWRRLQVIWRHIGASG